MTRVVTGELHRVQRGRRKGFVQEAPPARLRRPARVAVRLALAHQMQRAIDRGELPDQAAVARRLGLTFRGAAHRLETRRTLGKRREERTVFVAWKTLLIDDLGPCGFPERETRPPSEHWTARADACGPNTTRK